MKAETSPEYARREILAEVVAFANAQGGHVILGIDESTSHPKRASGISTIPACADLADRLRLQARDLIVPQLPVLSVRALSTDGESGVVIMRVGASRAAPHRLRPILECYIRRADRTEAMTMREIQDLTLQRERGLGQVEARFEARHSGFMDELLKLSSQKEILYPIGVRATLVPLTAGLWADQVYRRPDIQPVYQEFVVTWAGSEHKLLTLRSHLNARPVLGGVRFSTDFSGLYVRVEIFRDGVVDWRFFDSGSSSKEEISLTFTPSG